MTFNEIVYWTTYVMGSTVFDFGGTSHMKVQVIAYQKMQVRFMGGNFV